jgi:hypothetical protein
MKKRQILWAIVFGSMLAITGCGDDGNGGDGGSGTGGSGTGGSGTGGSGTGGSGTGGSGTGGSNGGPSNSTCEAICASDCVLGDVASDPSFDECVAGCTQGFPDFNDDCGSQADAFLSCMESNNCDREATECQNEAIAWGSCLAGVFL